MLLYKLVIVPVVEDNDEIVPVDVDNDGNEARPLLFIDQFKV